jgi:hypothetical protein
MQLDYSTLTVDQVVEIYCDTGWHQGSYKVLKVNKATVTVMRASDGFQRSFSVKTRQEKDTWSTRYTTAYMITREEHLQRERLRRQDRNELWRLIKVAANNENLRRLQELMVQLG